MKRTEVRHEFSWYVVENGDRWYRAVCRFAPNMFGNPTVSRIVRIQPSHASSLVARMKGVSGHVMVLWTISAGKTTFDSIELLDLISTIRTEAPSVYQVAAASPGLMTDWFLAAQEAGVASFLESIEMLPSLETHIRRRMAAFD